MPHMVIDSNYCKINHFLKASGKRRGKVLLIWSDTIKKNAEGKQAKGLMMLSKLGSWAFLSITLERNQTCKQTMQNQTMQI